MSILRRGLIATLLGVATLAIHVPDAHAQVAGAIGKPLSSPDLPTGTISVRVVAGTIASPVVGTDVTLVVNGTPRVARTDAAGRAQFPSLPAGAKVQAKVQDEDKQDITSDEFELDPQMGSKVLLSTKPFVPMGGAGGAPFAGGAGGPGGAGGAGMPDPRTLSGQPRGEATDQPGTFTVRLTYDDLANKTSLAGIPVFLVGYKGDDTVSMFQQVSDAEGRAAFTGLDRTGSTSYFATAQMKRGPEAAIVDRLVSTPSVLDSRSGIRLILSSEKRDSSAPAIDELDKLDKQDGAPEAGRVRIVLQGVPEEGGTVQLVAIRADGTKRTIGTQPVSRAAPDPKEMQAQSQFEPKADMAPHAIRIQVHGGGVDENRPVGGVSVRLVPAAAAIPDADLSNVGTEQKTPDTGFYDTTNDAKGPIIAIITVNGKEMQSQPIDLTKSGGWRDIETHWDKVGKMNAVFETPDVKSDEVLYAQTTMFNNTLFRSIPFQPVAAHGTKSTLFIVPRVLFTFSWTSHIDDEFLAVGGKFQITNNSWAPYIGKTGDGIIIPLPKNFKGARVGEQDQNDVAVSQGEGFRIGRPIPPGGKVFHAQFSMPIEAGKVEWSLDLPLGAFQSGLEIMQTPGMSVTSSASMHQEVATVAQGTYIVFPQISIPPKQSMQMTVNNLPHQPAWKLWAPRIVAIIAIFLMLGGLSFALYRSSTARSNERATRRARLLDELVALEKSGQNDGFKDDKRRIQITNELEQLWVD
ncbi:hypothetical protein BH11MYX1_BH11MYX1_02070 [soil metagenome]